MSKDICKLNMTVVDTGDSTEADIECEFEGTGARLAEVLAHILNAFNLSQMEARVLCAIAIENMVAAQVEEVEE